MFLFHRYAVMFGRARVCVCVYLVSALLFRVSIELNCLPFVPLVLRHYSADLCAKLYYKRNDMNKIHSYFLFGL